MQQPTLITILAALASAALYLSLALGVVPMPLVAYFVQLPLFFVGFSLGLTHVSIASATSLGLVLVFGGWVAGLAYLAVEAVPCLIVVRHALLNRTRDDGGLEWYPPGLLLIRLCGYAFAVMVLALLAVWVSTGSIGESFEAAIGSVLDELGMDAQATAMRQQVLAFATAVPGIVAASLVLMVAINAILGQFLARKGDRALRPSPQMAEIWLPGWCAPVLGTAALLSLLLGGDLAFFAQGAAILLAMPFLFQGLAVVHAFAGRSPSQPLVLSLFYVILVLFSWPLVLFVIGLGLVEDWAHLRRRFA